MILQAATEIPGRTPWRRNSRTASRAQRKASRKLTLVTASHCSTLTVKGRVRSEGPARVTVLRDIGRTCEAPMGKSITREVAGKWDHGLIAERSKCGEHKNCIRGSEGGAAFRWLSFCRDSVVDGPLALDNAINPEAANIKKIDSPVAGRANVLMVPDLEAGNMLAKSLSFLAGADAASVVLGARTAHPHQPWLRDA